jgi:hypothetical protein
MTAPPLPAAPEAPWTLLRVLGEADAVRLIELHGGTRIYVPHGGGHLALHFAQPAIGAIVAAWGGEYLKVPLARYWRARIYRARGMSYAQIARGVGATETSVWRWLNAAGDTAQGSLSLPDPTPVGMTRPRAHAENGPARTGKDP